MPDNSTVKQHTFDAIVIGSGISGGWAAKELCELGLKTLVLERGRNVEHNKDYPTATMDPWEFKHRGQMTREFLKENPLISRAAGFGEDCAHFFIKDKDHPYIQEKPFEWIRGYQVGGKSLTWGRACQRWSEFEFTNPARFGYGIEWPIGYADVAPWYSHVEKFIGVCGNKDGIESMPDGEFLPPFEMNCVQSLISQKIKENYPDRHLVHARWAHLTKPNQIHLDQGRAQCMARNECMRGCPFGGYFSSNSTTIPWAEKTGNLVLRPDSVVHSIIYDEKKGKAKGVRVIDAHTKRETEYFAKVIFVNAACINSNLILLNSTSHRFPDGLGNDNGLLGKYICFHNYRGTVSGSYDGPQDKYYYGRRPTQAMMPNFRNVYKQETDFLRGYMVHYSAGRGNAHPQKGEEEIGGNFKEAITEPGEWGVFAMMQGETVPKKENHVRLSKDLKDQWGIPQLITSVGYDDNDEKVLKDFLTQTAEMLEKAGCKNIQQNDSKQAPGLDIHEMGGCRMGKDPKTSLLNKWNQFHNCPNVFVTDGASMVSTSTQNPSITFMALTARAANHAVDELKRGNL